MIKKKIFKKFDTILHPFDIKNVNFIFPIHSLNCFHLSVDIKEKVSSKQTKNEEVMIITTILPCIENTCSSTAIFSKHGYKYVQKVIYGNFTFDHAHKCPL